ncbi:hypothetical protein ACFPT7_04775 [Acidicapsa dinghuensis]|uniref:Uncharacterized protein n=1 Tax=Acidicapsa dinghuensis TaxID=2218256 RepID=A0ABW1EEC1_9BACT|nr:hypothetical protein [Acidicapsa dinghuensis]
MRTFYLAALSAAIVTLSVGSIAQQPALTPNPAPAPAQSAPATAVQKPSAILQPSLDGLKSSISSLNLDKWKRGNVRQEAQDHISSIMADMQNRLPGLMTDADSAPAQISKTLPLSRNVDALYDVFLRVVDAARISAPSDQVQSLQQAQAGLEHSRSILDAQLQSVAADQDKQFGTLQVTLRQKEQALQTALATPPPAPKPEPCVPPKKKVVRKKTTPKPKPSTTQQPSTQQPAPQKPQN